MKVLGGRVLIRPDVYANAPESRESGIIVARSMAAAITGEDATTSLCRGTVIAVGTPQHPLKEEAESLAAKLDAVAHVSGQPGRPDARLRDAATFMRDLVRKQPVVTIGDDVLFSHEAGQEVTLDGAETLLLIKEDELLAVIESEIPA